MERERLQNYVGNGDRPTPTFSDAEMQRRLDAIRKVMADQGIDAALLEGQLLPCRPPADRRREASGDRV